MFKKMHKHQTKTESDEKDIWIVVCSFFYQ
jgi:hypothetical protein